MMIKKMERKRLIKISIYLRAPLNPGKVRVLLVPSLVEEAWILIGDVQTSVTFFGVQHLNIFKPILEQCICVCPVKKPF